MYNVRTLLRSFNFQLDTALSFCVKFSLVEPSWILLNYFQISQLKKRDGRKAEKDAYSVTRVSSKRNAASKTQNNK